LRFPLSIIFCKNICQLRFFRINCCIWVKIANFFPVENTYVNRYVLIWFLSVDLKLGLFHLNLKTFEKLAVDRNWRQNLGEGSRYENGTGFPFLTNFCSVQFFQFSTELYKLSSKDRIKKFIRAHWPPQNLLLGRVIMLKI
jgi:hypothetical protein